MFGQEYTVRASVSKNKVALNERFEYKIEISGKSTSLPNPDLPDLTNFAVLSGPNTSTSIQYINGAMSSSKAYSYILMPKKVGNFTIPGIEIEIEGNIYNSNAISIQVSKNQIKPNQH